MLVRLAACRRHLQAVSPQLDELLLATGNAFFGFNVTGPGITGGPATCGYANDLQGVFQLLAVQPDLIAWMNADRCTGALAVNPHMTALHSRGSRCAGLVKPREPKPSIHS